MRQILTRGSKMNAILLHSLSEDRLQEVYRTLQELNVPYIETPRVWYSNQGPVECGLFGDINHFYWQGESGDYFSFDQESISIKATQYQLDVFLKYIAQLTPEEISQIVVYAMFAA